MISRNFQDNIGWIRSVLSQPTGGLRRGPNYRSIDVRLESNLRPVMRTNSLESNTFASLDLFKMDDLHFRRISTIMPVWGHQTGAQDFQTQSGSNFHLAPHNCRGPLPFRPSRLWWGERSEYRICSYPRAPIAHRSRGQFPGGMPASAQWTL